MVAIVVNVLNSVIDSVLTHVLTWEHKPVVVSLVQGNGVVAEVNVLKRKFFHVLDESGKKMSLWLL